ncbi:doubled CXXCH domain-containing protein [Neobacillus bataviensis LMG 21833]|uniref:Doubled CXXCH domain-containing protein n=1 Tax=Neobacillus bataviensis LMG 21833 TaxID=1117379 RepID=K6DFN9_9BACI|nr:cytochrome c3 family protein [Neobacillus bataviensis]EKN71372.1 doubled CXXCH domain-containing protein [Neobacillus bataviensis LMG 21833]
MSKIKIGFSALLTLIMLSMFAALASAEGNFTPTPSNPAPGINVGTIDNSGQVNQHKTHGNFQNNTNSCANCHSTHNGDDSRLLKFKNAEYDMCLSCHDGTMGFYNVQTASGAGIFSESHESESMHNVSSGIINGKAPGAYLNKDTNELECSSCHNPHGSVNDRLLKENVIGSVPFAYGTVNGVKVPVQNGVKTINLSLSDDPDFAAINASTTNSGLKITKSIGPKDSQDKINYSQFCAACHDDYAASRTAGRPSNAGKTAGNTNHDFLYTHTSNSSSQGRNCAACHYAHGTDITTLMDTAGKTIDDLKKPVAQGGKGWSDAVAKDYMKDVSVGGSSNKKFTNMAVCWSCHQSTHKIDTPVVPGGDYSGKNKIR